MDIAKARRAADLYNERAALKSDRDVVIAGRIREVIPIAFVGSVVKRLKGERLKNILTAYIDQRIIAIDSELTEL
jgi:hypothetical protein